MGMGGVKALADRWGVFRNPQCFWLIRCIQTETRCHVCAWVAYDFKMPNSFLIMESGFIYRLNTMTLTKLTK